MGGGLGLFMVVLFCLVILYLCLVMFEINIGLYLDVGVMCFLVDCGVIGLFIGLMGLIMIVVGVYGIGWVIYICDVQCNMVFEKVINIDWSYYLVGDFRVIDDILNSMYCLVGLGLLQNFLDVIYSVCCGVNFEYDYDVIVGLSDECSDWFC